MGEAFNRDGQRIAEAFGATKRDVFEPTRISKANWPYSTWPEQTVVRVDKSPMNPKIKIAQLNCGHDVYRNRAPRIGATIICPKCAEKADRR